MNADTPESEPDPGDLKIRPQPDLKDGRDPLEALAEEFLDRMRRGERPAVSEFLARAPERVGELEELLSALLLVEGVKLQDDATSASEQAGWPRDRPGLERLGDFRILRELGRGGMGIVYEAEQESLNRHVAIKVLAPGTARSPQIMERFLREAKAAAQLHHTNIVPVFSVGEREGLHYYAMQFIRGLSLDKVLEEVRRLKKRASPNPDVEETAIQPALPVATDSDDRYARSVARIGLQVAQALEYAHQQGTLHRDVKPSNILLDVHGVAWVSDFGLAKAVDDEDLTRTGDLVGTIRYMAPERFLGLCDGRSDQYSLGLTLYELLALRPAFDSSNREGLLYQVNRVEPRLRSLNRAIPVDLETIVHKAIEKAAEHRYRHAADLADDLQCFLEDRPIAARRVSSTERLTRWARRNPGLATLGTALAGMLALVVAVIVVADLRLRRQNEETTMHLRRAEQAEGRAVSQLLDSYVANARAGRRGRFAGQRFEGLGKIRAAAFLDQLGDRVLKLRNEAIACLALPDLQPVRAWENGPQGGFLGVDFDPSSGRMARGTPQGDVLIRSTDPGGALVRLIGNGLQVVMVQYSRDGRYLAVKHEERGKVALVVWDTRRAEKLLDVPDGVHGDAVEFHPDGRTLAAGRRDGSIVLYDLNTRHELRRFSPGPVPHSIRFDSTGERFVTVSHDARDGIQVRAVKDGTIAASWAFPEPAHSVNWHPDGHRLAVGGRSGTIRLLDTHDVSRSPTTTQAHDGAVVALAFHPGGRLLASASWDGTMQLWDIAAVEQLVRCPLPEARPLRFSQDGRFLGPGLDGARAWCWEVAEGLECRSLVGAERGAERSWSVDFLAGAVVLASAGAEGVRLAVPGGQAAAFIPLTGTDGIAAAPDGSFLITSGATGLLRWPVGRSAAGDLRVGPPESLGFPAGLTTGRVRVCRDGRALAVVTDSELGRVVVLDLRGRDPPITLGGHPNLERLDQSPDGRWVVTGTWQGKGVKVWDARRGTLARELAVEGSAEVLFSPDGQSLVTASGDEYDIWDLSSWTRRLQIRRSQAISLPGQAAFSPDGRVLAITKTRSLVQLVDALSGRELATLEAPEPKNVSALRFSPDSRLLVVAHAAGGVLVWDLEALRHGLESVGLDWSAATGAGQVASPMLTPNQIVVAEAPWMAPLMRGEELARLGRSNDAGLAFEEAFALGARHLDAQARRALFRLARGDITAYCEACQELVRMFEASELVPNAANDIAWVCALGPKAVADYSRVVHLAEVAVASRPTNDRLNTLGAILYRAGRFEAAVQQLSRAVKVHGADGREYDALFLAMAHHQLGHAEESRRWLRLGMAVVPVATHTPGGLGGTSWITRLELEILRREASTTIEPIHP